MSLRVYATPWIGTGTKPDPYRSKMAAYTPKYVSFFPSQGDGAPGSSWVLAIGRLADWSAVEADATMVDIFGGDLPNTIESKADLVAALRARTIGSLPTPRRNAIQASLDDLGVPRADFTTATTMLTVFRRVVAICLEHDENFGTGFEVSV